MEDEELVERARKGEIDAYEQLVQRHQEVAFRTAYLIAGATGDAEDAVQEAFIKAFRALDRFRRGGSFKAWLLTIVANEARNRVRSASRRANLSLRASRIRPSGDAAPSPEEAALAASEREALLAALASLREGDRIVILYRYFLELDEGEMAEALRIARGTVKSRLSRALARLREALPADEPQEAAT